MKRLKRHNFVVFPYRPSEREDGESNNGGIDLVKEPARIEEIHELYGYPWLRHFVTRVNSPRGLFMTFGCAIGVIDDASCGYIDFSFRPDAPVKLRDHLVDFDKLFISYLLDAMPDEENRRNAIPYAEQILDWNISPLEILGHKYSKLNLTFHARQAEGAEWAIEHIGYFLTVHFPSLFER